MVSSFRDIETKEICADFLDTSANSTPYVSAPSSPGRDDSEALGNACGYCCFSAPASPSSAASLLAYADSVTLSGFEFEFAHNRSPGAPESAALTTMCSADELFLNGQIRPATPLDHFGARRNLSPRIMDSFDSNEDSRGREREMRLKRVRSLHRKARSLSPLRNANDLPFHCIDYVEKTENKTDAVSLTTPSGSCSSSRSSSSGRNPRKWVFLKDLLLHRSKSEGTGNRKDKEKLWSSITFSPSLAKDKDAGKARCKRKTEQGFKKPENGGTAVSRKTSPSPHELHYTANRAQAEELKKRTFLPYRPGVFGCLRFGSKSYGVLNNLARSMNPVSSK